MVPFQEHVDLLRQFLTRREVIAEKIEALLNAQRKHLSDQALLSRQIDDCFSARRTQLEEAHWAAGFKPRPVQDLHNDVIHPAEMMIRALYCWQQTRWPGRAGRLHYAHTLFNLHMLRYLQFLSMRIWDEDPGSAGARLAEMQSVLDELWRSSPVGQPALVRDARWLIPLAQSLITDELAPYFEVARLVTETLPEADVLAIQKAHVRMLGGHLTSQIRYYSTKDAVPIDDLSVVLRTRASNALDFALLVQGLVPLLKAYERGDDTAGAIFQGISPDPELFLNRIDLLSAYSMIEHLADSPLGHRHVELLKEYGALMARLIPRLRDDFPRFKPVDFSPYGVVFGLPSHLIEHMALKAVQHDAETRFSLEDVFDDGDAAKLAWVNGWRNLPHIKPEVQRMYEYPQSFTEEIYNRIERQLKPHEVKTGRLYIGDNPPEIPELPAKYFISSDRAMLLAGRREGHYLVSYETPSGWVALKKDLLTEVLGAGRDARVAGLPADATQVLRLMCADLIAGE